MPGIPVPLVYGTAICGSIVVSADLEIEKVED
jgi:predicted phage tail protein